MGPSIRNTAALVLMPAVSRLFLRGQPFPARPLPGFVAFNCRPPAARVLMPAVSRLLPLLPVFVTLLPARHLPALPACCCCPRRSPAARPLPALVARCHCPLPPPLHHKWRTNEHAFRYRHVGISHAMRMGIR